LDRKVSRRARCAGAGVLVLLASAGPAVAGSPGAGCAGAGQAPAVGTRGVAATAIVCVLNQRRARRALPRLHEHPKLVRAGRRYARDMVRRQFFSHTSPDGAGMVDRLLAVGYLREDLAWKVGETLAWGWGTQATPAATVDAWLANPPHRVILLDPDYRDIGVGVQVGAPVAGED